MISRLSLIMAFISVLSGVMELFREL